MTRPNKPYVLVVWEDAHATLDELTQDEIVKMHKPSMIHTRGWLIVDNDVGVWVASEWLPGDPETWRGNSFVPRGMIVSVTAPKRRAKRTIGGDGADDRILPALRTSRD